tara:strand:+ start:400 stop:867 length:468 start_codon:yes stop_codon:yes gene_type:complete
MSVNQEYIHENLDEMMKLFDTLFAEEKKIWTADQYKGKKKRVRESLKQGKWRDSAVKPFVAYYREKELHRDRVALNRIDFQDLHTKIEDYATERESFRHNEERYTRENKSLKNQVELLRGHLHLLRKTVINESDNGGLIISKYEGAVKTLTNSSP